jgi:hypothetical protein
MSTFEREGVMSTCDCRSCRSQRRRFMIQHPRPVSDKFEAIKQLVNRAYEEYHQRIVNEIYKEVTVAEKTVKVDGIVLTKTQVEKAYQELNAPAEQLFPGDIVERDDFLRNFQGKRFLVLGGRLDEIFDKKYSFSPRGSDEVRLTDGKSTWTVNRSKVRKVGYLKGSK